MPVSTALDSSWIDRRRLAGKSFEGNGYGRSVDLVMGAGGAVAGGLVTRSAGFFGYGGTIAATVVAVPLCRSSYHRRCSSERPKDLFEDTLAFVQAEEM
jgi:hypothetical protein